MHSRLIVMCYMHVQVFNTCRQHIWLASMCSTWSTFLQHLKAVQLTLLDGIFSSNLYHLSCNSLKRKPRKWRLKHANWQCQDIRHICCKNTKIVMPLTCLCNAFAVQTFERYALCSLEDCFGKCPSSSSDGNFSPTVIPRLVPFLVRGWPMVPTWAPQITGHVKVKMWWA